MGKKCLWEISLFNYGLGVKHEKVAHLLVYERIISSYRANQEAEEVGGHTKNLIGRIDSDSFHLNEFDTNYFRDAPIERALRDLNDTKNSSISFSQS